MKTKKGFTLSEVMLVLSVIGVIAALTIPGLIQSTQNKQLVTQLKKEYTTLSQAYTSLVADNDGDINSVFSGTATASDNVNVMNAFVSKMNVLKNCGIGMGCWYDSQLKYLGGTTYYATPDTSFNSDYRAKVVLADGSMLAFKSYSGNCSTARNQLYNVCGWFAVDVNGAKGPNTGGRDFFGFWVAKTGIIPMGSNDDGDTCIATSNTVSTTDGCAAKVLQESAMNY